MRERTSAGSVVMLAPATQALPEVGGSKVVSIRNVVDLPAPFGPRKATNSPAATSISTPFTASTVSFLLTKCLVSASVWIIGDLPTFGTFAHRAWNRLTPTALADETRSPNT